MNLLNKNNNISILIAGIIAVIIGLGITRFAFTSLLPPMIEGFLTVSFAGILASFNYIGYLSGSIFSMFIKDINKKVIFFRIGIILCLLTTIILGITENQTIWFIARLTAGVSGALAFVVGSAIVMSKLNFQNKTKAMGIHFSGIGFSIFVTDIIARAVQNSGGSWKDSWIVLTIITTILALYSMYILSFDKSIKVEKTSTNFDKSLFTPFTIIIIISYFTMGIGFVVQATFLPDIINSIKELEGYGSMTWTIVGLAGIPSCIIWMSLASKYGSVNIIIITMGLLGISILIPTVTSNIYLNLLSGVLYGGTFIALVGLFMNLGGKLAGKSPVVLMGAFTIANGIGQVIAPLYSVYFIEKFSSYNYALYLTSFIVFCGILLLFFSKTIMTEEQKKI